MTKYSTISEYDALRLMEAGFEAIFGKWVEFHKISSEPDFEDENICVELDELDRELSKRVMEWKCSTGEFAPQPQENQPQ